MTAHLESLFAAVQSPDADRTTWLVLADALEECDRTDEADLIRDESANVMIVDGVVYDADLRTYTYHEEGGHSEELDADSMAEAVELARELARGGDWGESAVEGCEIDVTVTEHDASGEETDRRNLGVEIGPDHDTLIRRAARRDRDRLCGTDPDDHDWTSEGEGGCDENPGVWSTGGTSMHYASHCRACGLHRNEYTCGSQRNPGDHDRTEYEMPARWCVKCQSDDCDCGQDEE